MHWIWLTLIGVVGSVLFIALVTYAVYLGEVWGLIKEEDFDKNGLR